MAEGPSFIALNMFTGEFGKADVLEVGAGGANLCQEPQDGMLRHPSHPFRTANGIAFNEGGDDLDTLGGAELIHGVYYTCTLKHKSRKNTIQLSLRKFNNMALISF
jgi:hypothetical protein